MSDFNTVPAAVHRLELVGRERLVVSGVEDVDRFDETGIVMSTTAGTLVVTGEDLHIGKLSLDGGELHVDGRIDSVAYEEGGPASATLADSTPRESLRTHAPRHSGSRSDSSSQAFTASSQEPSRQGTTSSRRSVVPASTQWGSTASFSLAETPCSHLSQSPRSASPSPTSFQTCLRRSCRSPPSPNQRRW